MKRRSFLQMVAGMFGAASVGAAAELLAGAATQQQSMAIPASALSGAFRLFYNMGTYDVPRWIEVGDATSAKLVYESASAVMIDLDLDQPAGAWMATREPLSVDAPFTPAPGWPAWTGTRA